MSFKTSHRRSEIQIAIICALPIETKAVEAVMHGPPGGTDQNQEGEAFSKSFTDRNAYTFGYIYSHPVVLVHMPGMGKESAASVAVDLKQSFQGIRLALLVGVCAGVPNENLQSKRRLGDVVIGKSVVQYDYGREFPDGVVQRRGVEDVFGRQNKEIRSFVAKLEAAKVAIEQQAREELSSLLSDRGLHTALTDDLYLPDYWHMHHLIKDCDSQYCIIGRSTCEVSRTASCEDLGCGAGGSGLVRSIKYSAQSQPKPAMHFGSIGCGDVVMKSGERRDKIAKAGNLIAFEMESIGLWENLPCLVVKSICDYADSHKNKSWQEFCALTAAAYTKAIIGKWPKIDGQESKAEANSQGSNVYNATIGFGGHNYGGLQQGQAIGTTNHIAGGNTFNFN